MGYSSHKGRKMQEDVDVGLMSGWRRVVVGHISVWRWPNVGCALGELPILHWGTVGNWRCPDVGPTLARRWPDVGPTLARRRPNEQDYVEQTSDTVVGPTWVATSRQHWASVKFPIGKFDEIQMSLVLGIFTRWWKSYRHADETTIDQMWRVSQKKN